MNTVGKWKVTVGKWQIWKCQDADSIHHGHWLINSPWYLKSSHYIKDLAGFYTWQEAIDHINERVAAR